MKQKSNIVCKRVSLVLSGAMLLCLLNACTAGRGGDENADYGNISSAVEEPSANKIDQEGQNLEISDGQSLVSADASGEQTQPSADANGEQTQSSVDVSSEQSQVSADVSNKQQSAFSKENDEMPPLSLEEYYRAILLEDGEFISTDLQNRKLNLGAIKEVVTDDDSIRVTASKFTITDLDGDGEEELVLWLQINDISDYGFEILRYREDAVYGYTLPYRAFMDLKTDGTFIFSGGSADSGIGKLGFSADGYIVEPLHYNESGYDSNDELKMQYFVNGEAGSEEEFNDVMRRQEEKPDATWYDLSVDGVDRAFRE